MIADDHEFRAKLEQLSRLYTAMREIWAETDATNEEAIARWVITAGKVLDKLNIILAEVEEYTGSSDLRVIVSDLRARRAEKQRIVAEGS